MLPVINLEIDINLFFGASAIENIAAGTKISYEDYSELRDHVRALLNDQIHFKTLSYKPSDENGEDRKKQVGIREMHKNLFDPDTGERNEMLYENYGNKVSRYLEDEPSSKSFYVVCEVLDESRKPIAGLILDARISNHIDSNDSKKAFESGQKKKFLENRFKINDLKLKQVRIILSAKSKGTGEFFQAEIPELSKGITIHCSSIEDTKTWLTNSILELYREYLSEIPQRDETINGCSRMRYDVSGLEAFLQDMVDALNAKRENEYWAYMWPWTITGYRVVDGYLTRVYTMDDDGGEWQSYFDEPLHELLNDTDYQEDIIETYIEMMYDAYDPGLA